MQLALQINRQLLTRVGLKFEFRKLKVLQVHIHSNINRQEGDLKKTLLDKLVMRETILEEEIMLISMLTARIRHLQQRHKVSFNARIIKIRATCLINKVS